MSNPKFRKSTRSQGGGNCVEVADGDRSAILVRDSKDQAGPVLSFGPGGWGEFVSAMKQGRFDLS